MGGITLPKGTVSIYTFPLYEQGDSYRTCCNDFHITIFIKPPNNLRKYFEKASKNWSRDDNGTFTPCVIERRVHRELPHHKAILLAPPNITEQSNLFATGLLVPDLEVSDIIDDSNSAGGYILKSNYLGAQKFYATPSKKLDTSRTYQAIIETVYKDGRRKPTVRIFLGSNEDPNIFKENTKKLEEIANSKANFWWNLSL